MGVTDLLAKSASLTAELMAARLEQVAASGSSLVSEVSATVAAGRGKVTVALSRFHIYIVLSDSVPRNRAKSCGYIYPQQQETLTFCIKLANFAFSVPDPDPPDPHVFGPPGSGSGSTSQMYGSGSFYHHVTLFDFLSLKNDVNVPSKSNKQKKLC